MASDQTVSTEQKRAIFKNAEVFSRLAALVEAQMSTGDMSLAVTYPTLAAFSLELYLKCLLYVQGAPGVPHVHNLKELFRNLNSKTKAELRKEHDKLAGKDPTFNLVKKRFGNSFDLDTLLEEGQDAFDVFRYCHEGIKEGSGFSLNIFSWCVRKRLLKSHPEWAS